MSYLLKLKDNVIAIDINKKENLNLLLTKVFKLKKNIQDINWETLKTLRLQINDRTIFST